MRIWIGKEQEGQYFGQETMFVESPILLKWHLEIIYEMLEKHPYIKRLYVGAGRKDCTYVETPLDFLDKLFVLEVTLIQEMDVTNTRFLSSVIAESSNTEIVLTLRDSKSPVFRFENLSFKIDNFNEMVITQSGKMQFKGLSTVENNTYKDVDTVIYDDYK
jgi:hypothetical protein